MSAAETPVTPEGAELLIALLAERADAACADEHTWMAAAREAVRQGVLPQLYARTRTLPAGAVPGSVAALVQERYKQAALWNAVLFRELDLIVRTLAAHDIPVLLLKGLHLGTDVYAAPAVRTMGDLDILVPREQLAAAGHALTEAGFTGPAVADLDDYCRANSHLPRMNPPKAPGGAGVEVHWSIELPTSPFDIRPAELWASARPLSVNGRAVSILSPEHLLLHLCLHACYHHRFSHTPLKQLCDIAATLRRYDAQIDWDLLAGTAERWGVQSFVRFTLLLTRDLLGADLPAAVEMLPADSDETRLLDNARAYILNCTLDVPTALTQAMRARSWSQRVRSMFLQIFPPPARLAGIYGLQRGSARVYMWYAARPFDLLLRKGHLTLELLLPGRTGRRLRYTERNRFLLKAALTNWTRAARPPANGTGAQHS